MASIEIARGHLKFVLLKFRAAIGWRTRTSKLVTYLNFLWLLAICNYDGLVIKYRWRLIVNNTFRKLAITGAHDDVKEQHGTALSNIKLILISGNKL